MATIGNLVNKVNLKYFVSIGMIISAVFYSFSAILYLMTGSFYYVALVIFMCFNGIFQSTGWPGIMGIMGNWFGKGKRGLLMGIWGINGNIGNIIALVLCDILDQEQKLPWTYNFLVTGSFTIVIGILCLLFLSEKPK